MNDSDRYDAMGRDERFTSDSNSRFKAPFQNFSFDIDKFERISLKNSLMDSWINYFGNRSNRKFRKD